jgi:threonine dehydratase
MITLENIQQAKQRLETIIRPTPLAYAPILSANSGADIYLKKENLQLTGSFKLRGAFNKIAKLSDQERAKGFICGSK